jgi:hypothetical protein
VTTDLTSPAELVLGYESQIKELNGKRLRLAEQLSVEPVPGKTDYAKRLAVQAELDDIDAKIVRTEEQLADAQAAVADERRAAQEQENRIADFRARIARACEPVYRDRMTIAAWGQEITLCRQGLVDLGEDDPGDQTLSAEQVYAPIAERDRRVAENMQAMMEQGRSRATPEQVDADRRRVELADQLFREGYSQAEAERVAGLVVDDGMTLELALQPSAAEEETDAEVLIEG